MNLKQAEEGAAKLIGFLHQHERWVIAILLGGNLLHFWLTRYVPSLDGPHHLYNANVLLELLGGNDFFREFFRMNNTVVGYWSGHFVLTVFDAFLPAWLAEKCMLSAYAIGMFFAFRYLVRSLNPEGPALLIYLVLPFIFHMYLLFGYYSFSIAAVFYFWAFGYWIRHRAYFRWKQMLAFGAIVTGVFLSHGLVFLFFGASFVLFFLSTSVFQLLEPGGRARRPVIWDQAWRLALAVLPAVLLWGNYIRTVMSVNNAVEVSSYYGMELLRFLLRIRQLVGFSPEVEGPAFIVLFSLLLLLALFALFTQLRAWQQGREGWTALLDPGRVWIWVALMFAFAYFFAPDRISAGSLTHRFGLYFYFALLVFLAHRPVPGLLQLLALLVIVGVCGVTRVNQHAFLQKLNADVVEIKELSPLLEEGTTMISLNSSENWVHRNISLYIADDRPVVHLGNPQCAGQFPVEWNAATLPLCYTGSARYYPVRSDSLINGTRSLQVDYISILHPETFWETPSNSRWHEIVSGHYELLKASSRGRVALYRRQHWELKPE